MYTSGADLNLVPDETMDQHAEPDAPHPDGPPEPADPARRQVLEQLLDLAQDASSYLRHHHRRAVRASAALLLAASVAACSPFSIGGLPALRQAQPLRQEVRSGLPSQPGRYSLAADSLGRDAQGVYHFGWLPPGAGAGAGNPASASLVRLAQGERDELEVPAQGDPILYLRGDTPVPLIGSADELRTPTPGSGTSSGSRGVAWYPFYSGTNTSTPTYRNPPTSVDSDRAARGSTASSTPPSPSSRMSGLPYAVSGQGGGTGSGTAASSRVGGGSSFVGGQSGGTGSGSAASGKSGSLFGFGGSSSSSSSSGSSVSGSRSGGFSGGFGGGSSGSSAG